MKTDRFNRYFSNISGYVAATFRQPFRLFTLILPPAAVMIIVLAAYALNGMYPFGEKTLALCDMHQQVLPLMLDFKDILAGKSSFFLSMQNASGMNFYGVFLFFISSPFTFLVAFVDKADMMVFMNILTLLKLMLCSITANIYFRHCHKKLNLYFSAALSVMYAFSGYAMLFFQNTVWLDVMYFFPLLLISFESLIKRRKTGGLIFCLTGMLVLNYYLSYMVVLFTILYFGLYLFMHRKKCVTKGIAPLFIISCIIAAMLSAVIWLPSFSQYLSSARGTNVIEGLLESELFTAIYTNLSLLLCTGFAFAVIIAFFARRISTKSRFYILLFVFMLLPVIFEPINKMWHTGDYMAFPVRYGYITTFLVLIYAAVKLKYIAVGDFAEKSDKRFMLPAFAVIALFAVFSVWYYLTYKKELDSYAATLWGDFTSFTLILIVACGFVGLFLFMLLCAIFKKASYKVFCIGFSLVLVFECFFNTNVYLCSSAYLSTQYDSAIVLEDKISDDDFYRVKLAQSQRKYFDANLIGGLGYNTISHYTSLTSEDYMFAMKKMGYSSYWMEVTGNGGTLLTDALMSIKYTIKKFNASSNAVYRDKNYTILQNEYYLPLGLVTDTDLSKCEELPSGTRLQIQEYLANTLLSGDELIFTEYKPTEFKNVTYRRANGTHYFTPKDLKQLSTIRYKIYVDEKQTLYFDAFDKISRAVNEHVNNTFSVYVNGIKTDLSFPNKDSNGLLELGTFENEIVTVDIDVNKFNYFSSFGIYGISHSKLEALLDKAITAGLEVNGDTISGSVTADKDGEYLFLSVPYDSGFTAYVNGKETEIYRCMDGFMAIKLNSGENDISFTFLPSGFKTGFAITAVGAVLLVLWTVLRKKAEPVLMKTDKLCRVGVYVLYFGVIAVVYVLPMALCIIGYFIQKPTV